MQVKFRNLVSEHHDFSVDELLTPLALTVIIDNKVRDPEMNEFAVQAEGLLEMLEYTGEVTREKILLWFKRNEPSILEAIRGRKKNTFILKSLTRFKDNTPLIEAIYDAMLAISISDKEYHIDESELIKSASSLWGYVRPPFKVISRQ